MNDLNELIDKLIHERIESVAASKGDPELCDRFAERMQQQYGKYNDRLKAAPEIAPAMLEEWYRSEKNAWGKLSDDDVYSRFTPDEALLKIDELSSRIFSMAIEKKKSGASDKAESAKEYLASIKNLSPNVMKENSKLAAKLISECTVEVDYICGSTENMSFRMANYLRNRF